MTAPLPAKLSPARKLIVALLIAVSIGVGLAITTLSPRGQQIAMYAVGILGAFFAAIKAGAGGGLLWISGRRKTSGMAFVLALILLALALAYANDLRLFLARA